MDEKALGGALQAARKKAGLTQQELCQQAGLSYSTLAKIERGAIKAPSIFTIHQIGQVLGVTLDELVGSVLPAPRATMRKVSKTGVRFIFFDVNGCLVRFFHPAFTRLAEESGRPADFIETTFWHYNDDVCRGRTSLEEFNHEFGARLGLKNFDWFEYYFDAIEPIKEMHDLLKWAASQYQVGLLTNIMPGQITVMKERGLIPDIDYSVIIDSSEAKAIKPEPAIFELAASKTDCRPEEILLVDDSRSNVMAAERQGWHVLWFDDYRTVESAARVREALEPAS